MPRKKRGKYITGLDIGTTKICAIIGQIETDGQLTILGVGSNPSLGMKKGIVQWLLNEVFEKGVTPPQEEWDDIKTEAKEKFVTK